jgi:flagellar hook assembly protein FlgD
MSFNSACKRAVAGATAAVLVSIALVSAVPAAYADDLTTETLVESFDHAALWAPAGGTVTVAGASTSTEGAGALAMTYDLARGSAEINPLSAVKLDAVPQTALKIDARGDGTYNTLYVKLRDSTGEVFLHRVANLNSKNWQTFTVDLSKAAASSSGGNADKIMDAPVSVYRLVVARNSTQPATGTAEVDNLRAVTNGWTLPAADSTYMRFTADATLPIRFHAGTAGDYSLTLSDEAGHERTSSGTASDAGDQEVLWDGLDDASVAMVGNISATLRFDVVPDATVSTGAFVTSAGTITTVADATDTEGTTVVDSFDNASIAWNVTKGSATITTAAQPTEGSGAAEVVYDVSAGNVELGRAESEKWAPLPYSSVKMDVQGDGLHNTLYLKLKDASGEEFMYRVGTLNTTQWKTFSVDLSNAPAQALGGNADGVLDAPLTAHRLVVARNGVQDPTGSFKIDNLRTVTEGWTHPTADTDYLDPSTGATAAIAFTAGTSGDYSVLIKDGNGKTRTIGANAPTAGEQTLNWDGTDDDGAPMVGNVSATLSYDTSADGNFGAPVVRSTLPMLTTVADTSVAISTILVDAFDEGGYPWQRAMGTTSATTVLAGVQGIGALSMGYDLSAGTAELTRTGTPAELPSSVYSALKIDYKGDGTYNTLYVKMRDATGEVFLYRVGNLNKTQWQTGTVDLTRPPAQSTAGNADGVLDAPLSLQRLVVSRNGDERATGTVVVDNLRALSDGWTLPSADVRYFIAGTGGTTVHFRSGSAGDYRVALRDLSGHSITFKGTVRSAGAIDINWDGKDSAGQPFRGLVSATLSHDNSADGALASDAAAAGRPYFAGATAKARTKGTGSIAGANSFMTTFDDAAKADADAKLMEEASLRYAREEFDWNRVEPRKGYFEWAKFDQAVEVAAARNLDVVGKLVYSAAWASSAPAGTPQQDIAYYPPTNLTDYTDYVREVVERYKDRVSVWEVWNEPNIQQYWKPAPDSAAYAAMLKATYATIKSIDPDATVLTAGFAGVSDGYMKGLVDAGAAKSYDGLAIHTFTSGAPEQSITDSWIQGAKTFNARNNPTASLWITELGWSTCTGCPNGVTEEQQAQYLSRAYLDAAATGVSGITWFNLRELGDSGSSLHNYGLVTSDGRKKPAYTALARTASSLNQTIGAGTVAPTADGASHVASDMATLTGFKASPLKGGSAKLTAVTSRHGGDGGLRLDYDYGAIGTGAVVAAQQPISGSPTALSLWVYGDNSNSPVYLKFTDATGESFEAKVGNAGLPEWERMTFYFDGGNPNLSRSGGDGDGVIDYPITVTAMHVYKSTSGVTSGQIHLDDLSAHYGPTVRGTMLMGRNFNIQAIYGMKDSTVSIPVAAGSAYYEDREKYQTLSVRDGKAAVAVSPMPRFVVSTLSTEATTAARNPVSVSWQGSDRARMTVQIITAKGVTVRTLSSRQPYDSGARRVTWDAKKSNGDWAASGNYKFRVETWSADGRSSVVTRPFTLN